MTKLQEKYSKLETSVEKAKKVKTGEGHCETYDYVAIRGRCVKSVDVGVKCQWFSHVQRGTDECEHGEIFTQEGGGGDHRGP